MKLLTKEKQEKLYQLIDDQIIDYQHSARVCKSNLGNCLPENERLYKGKIESYEVAAITTITLKEKIKKLLEGDE